MTTVLSVPARAAVVEREQLAMDGRGVAEAVRPHVLRDGVGRAKADHAIAGRLVGLADRGHGEAFAGAGLAVDDRQAFRAGRMAERAGLLARDAVELFAVEHAPRSARRSTSWPLDGRQAFGRAQHMQLGLEHGARRVARDRAARCLGESRTSS